MDDLAALRLQIEWGADEALLDAPLDRFAPARPALAPAVARPSLGASVALASGPAPSAATTLAELHQALDGFDACPLRATASTTVAPSGNPAAGLVLVGEAPGPDDDRSGQAFSGPPGQALDRVLASAGLGREALLLTLLVPWRPPGGRPANEAEIAQCLPFLHQLLALTRPRHLVLMGAGPLRALLPEAGGLRQVRGRWIETVIPGIPAPVPTLPVLAPDQWLKNPAGRQAIWADLLLLRDALTVH